MKKLYYLLTMILISVLRVQAHTGHPEDQLINGIDNTVLIYLGIIMVLIIIGVVAYIQGKQASKHSKN